MARFDFGGTLADFVVTSRRLGGLDVLGLSAATLTFWSAQSGGTQYTDLVLNGSAATSITVGTDGQVPKFQGPDGVTEMWADGGSPRVRVVTLQGAPGPAGKDGVNGLPGVNAVANDTAAAGYVSTAGSATQAALDARFPKKGNLWLNVKDDFGAKGDGTTDDTSAIQSAFTAATTGDTVYFPKGVYRFGNVSVTSKTNLTVWAPSATFKMLTSPTAPLLKATTCTNLKIDVAEIDGNNFAGAGQGIGMQVVGCTGFKFRGYIHHTWNHGLYFATTPSTNVDIELRFANVGAGYNLDNTFNANFPNGCPVYIASSAPVTDGRIKINGTDVKGGGAIYVGGCTRLVIDNPRIRRTGYRGIVCAGTDTVVGLKIIEPDISECGVLYEIDPATKAPGSSLYGQGTNGIFQGLSPVTAQDCVITGGHIRRVGEDATEGKAVITGLTAQESGYPYPNFGSGLAKSLIYAVSGSTVKGCTLSNAGTYGVHYYLSTAGMTDITVMDNLIVDPTLQGVRMQQDVTGAMTRVVVKGNTIIQTTNSPTHGVYMQGTGAAGTVAASSMALDNTIIGTFSTADIAVASPGLAFRNANSDPTGGGTATTTPPQIDVFTANGTWTKPTGAKLVRGVLIGGGAGGGSGRRDIAGTARCGGGGGAGGAQTVFTFDPADLTATVSVGIGTAGPGGAAVATDTTSGNAGTSGGATTFGFFAAAAGGSAGQGGTGAAGTGGFGGQGTTTGANGGAATTTAAGAASAAGGAGAGGSGGVITTANVPSNGGTGIYSRSQQVNTLAGGVVDGASPATGTAPAVKGDPGPGAGGGAASITTAAQAGGTPVGFGGGGGGGGASLNGNASGAGGAGAPGYALIITQF